MHLPRRGILQWGLNFNLGIFMRAQFFGKLSLAALAIMMIASIFSLPAKASPTMSQCNGTSIAAVQSCCSKWVKKNGEPVWMQQGGASCSSSVVCTSGAAAGKGKPFFGIASIKNKPKKVSQLCYVDASDVHHQGSGQTPPPPPKAPPPKPSIVGKP